MISIDLEEILVHYPSTDFDGENEYQMAHVLQAMREACIKTVEACAESTTLSLHDFIVESFNEVKLKSNHYSINDGTYIGIDYESIDKVKQLIK